MKALSKLRNNSFYFMFLVSLYLPVSLYSQAPPEITGIPDMETNEGQAFAAIPLDSFVTDPDNNPDELLWSYKNNIALDVVIENRVALVSAHDENWNGSETIVFTVTDPGDGSDSDEAIFTVNAVNDAPVITDVPGQSLIEGSSFQLINLDACVTDVDNLLADLAWTYSGDDNVTVTIDPSRLATITADSGWTGTDQVTFTVHDPGNLWDEDEAAFTVTESVPVAQNDSYAVLEGGTLSTPAPGVLSNDTDADGDILSAFMDSDPVNFSSFTLGEDGSIAYTHDGSETGSDVFTYVANDGTVSSAPATVTITVTPVNDPPVITDIIDQTIDQDSNFADIALNTLVSDAEDSNNLLAWTATGSKKLHVNIDETTHIASISAPDHHWAGTETIVFTVTDTQDGLDSDAANFTRELLSVAPTDITLLNSTVAENTPAPATVGTLSTADADAGDTFTYSLVSGAGDTDNGIFSISGNELSTSVSFNFETKPSCSVRIRSTGVEDLLWFEKNFTITVTNVNEAPVLNEISGSGVTFTEDAGAVVIFPAITVAEPDNTNLASAAATIASGLQTTEDVLSFVSGGGITGSYESSTGVLTLAGSANATNYQTVLRSVRYNNTSQNPNTTSRNLTFVVYDGTLYSNTLNKTVSIIAANDPPVLSGIEGAALSYGEGDGAVQITNTIAVADVDNANLSSATISVSANFQSGEDVLSCANTYGLTGAWSSGTYTLTGSATLSNYQLALRAMRYNNTSSNPSTLTRTITFYVNDGTFNSNAQTRNITIGASNNAPVLSDPSSLPVSFTENGGSVQLTSTILVSDADNANLASATVTIGSGWVSAEDVLSYTGSGGIGGTYNPATGVLFLSGSATPATYQTVLRSVRYNNTSENPNTTSRSISFIVSDGDKSSSTINKTVSITATNDAPVLTDPLSTPVSFTENGGSVRLTSTILVSDADNANLASATITISSGWVSAEDVLTYTGSGGIGGTYNPATGVLSLSGSATPATYQTVLRSVRYNNTSEIPNSTSRVVSFTVSDGTASGTPVNKTVNITAVNDLPELSGIEGTPLSYSEGDGARQITNSIAVADPDDATLVSATIAFTDNYQGDQDVLSCENSYGLAGAWNPVTGEYKLTGTGTLANYRDALRAMRYTNTSVNPVALSRIISFVVFDGADNSNSLFRVITINSFNNPPVLADPSSVIITYIEDTPAEQLTNTITVADVDNTSLVSAAITITSGLQSAEDTLSFTSGNNITGIYTPATGTLALTGITTLINYQAALRSVKYRNKSHNPTTGNRVIAFTVSDGITQSNGINKTVTITPVNDAPVLADPSASSVNYTENGLAVQLTNTITITDAENTTLVSASIAITAGFRTAEDTLSFTSANGITGSYAAASGILSLTGPATLASYRTALRSVRYRNKSDNPTITNRIISFTVSDGNAVNPISNIIAKTVTITAANDPPTATNVIITASNDRIGTLNTGSFLFTDPDGDLPGLHVYKWYRSDFATGIPATVIPGANTTTYRPVKADGAKYICFEVTPVDTGDLAGAPVKSAFRYINAAPVASNAYIYAPSVLPGDYIKGRFTYYDKEGNPRGVSIYHWYRSDLPNPTPALPGTSIGTTDSTYRVVSADADKYIWFRVHPVAQAGSTPGDSVWSNVIGPIGQYTANIAGSDTFCYGATMPITLTITAGEAPYTAILHRAGTAAKDTTIAAIASSPRVIQVKIPGTYTLTKVTDVGLDEANVTASKPVVLVINPKAKALLTGSATICNDGVTRASLSLNFTAGVSPWEVTVRRKVGLAQQEQPENDTTFTGVTADPFTFQARVIGTTSTRHRIFLIRDANGCPGDTASGSALVSYKASPSATISGIDSICPGETAKLTVTLSPSSTPPWSFTYLRDGANQTTVSVMEGYAYTLSVTDIGAYTLSGVTDMVCTGRVSGTGYVRSHVIPAAIITGTAAICEHTSANLSVAITGNAPWKYAYRFNSEPPIEVLNVTSSPNSLSVKKGGTYTLFEVYDRNCKGTVSGSAVITITPSPDATISGLDPAYNIGVVRVPIYGTPASGFFKDHPGLIPYNNVMHFWPIVAGIGTHQIVYNYQDPGTRCFGYDTAIVRVIMAQASIIFENERKTYCLNDDPFKVVGVNIKNVTGHFTINGGTGLVDNNDNTATITPSGLIPNRYTITYTYYDDGAPAFVQDYFDIGNNPNANFKWATECFQTGQPIAMTNTSDPVSGYFTDSSFVWRIFTSTGFIADSSNNIAPVFAEPGNHIIELSLQTTFGCFDTVTKTFALRPTIKLVDTTYYEDFETNPIDWRSGTDPNIPRNSWKLGNPSKHDSPLRGFSGAASGVNCWYTSILTDYAPVEQSYVSSPCFDFRGTQRPMLKARIWRLFSDTRDGASFEASTDSGKSWLPVGGLNDGINWFNANYGIAGKQSIGWTATKDANWVQPTRHSLDAFKGQSQVQFRFSYGAIGTAYENDGLAFDDVWIVERNRTALIEHFTNSSDLSCISADSTLDAFMTGAQQNAIDLQYHTSNPANDPFYEHNKVIPTTRQYYYGLSDVPYAVLDGGTKNLHRFDYINDSKPFNPNQPIIESLIDSKFDIRMHNHFSGNTLVTEAEIFNLQEIPLTELSVRIAVIERVVEGITGNNGDKLFRSVVKAMLPDAAGTTIYKAWGLGESSRIRETWNISQVYDPDELRVVVFVQDESTREVYQAAIDTISISTGIGNPLPRSVKGSYVIYPNPAQRQAFIRFDQETKEDLTLQMFNNTGSLVYTTRVPKGTGITEFSLEEFPDGLYLLRLMTNQKLLGISKVVISK